MERISLLEMLMQAENGETQEVMRDFVRGVARSVFVEAMVEEVETLCGPSHQRDSERDHVRAGSASGVLFYETRSESVRRPRVRRRGVNGKQEETRLMTYEAGKSGPELREAILRAFAAGVSARGMEEAVGCSKRTSKSEVSRLWQQRAAECIEAVRGRSLESETYVALMLDGVVLSEDLTAVVALGVTAQGQKQMLDFEIGSSENASVCTALTDRLVERGLGLAARRPFAVLDGSAALRKAVRKHWPEALIQTCLVHISRRIRARLSRRHHGELERLFNRLRKSADLEAASEALGELARFVAAHSAQGLKTLENAGGELLALFRLGVPDTFNKPLLSTNSIENSIRNMRRMLDRVNRWRPETDMGAKWMASAMLEAEKGFRRIDGHRHLPVLVEALNRRPDPEEDERYEELISAALSGSRKRAA